ncbi:nitrate- and nitrite sensing domain-containing protein [Stakelama tenebrarum]|uniref:HAMP domain-containing protein n=1 Tax=Stakelama tenebrarum TaxID=2711215 RepID=A0A6G6Y254_9SPHN|nr:nitrate- and nitrite sensing domain-containing protein [Sphingosinithalassobacter tenebrarum]QIG78798.1 HAMP domain-containing protein [Sphingosinithalassobacter tenebrarum]
MAAFLAAGQVKMHVDERADGAMLVENSMIATQMSDLVHELQRERGLSAGHVASRGARFASALGEQRKRTDGAREALARSVDAAGGAATLPSSTEIAQLLKATGEVSRLRGTIDGFAVTVPELAGLFTEMIEDGLDGIEGLATHGTARNDASARATFITLQQIKESAGLERAMGAQGFGAGAFPMPVYRTFVGLIAQQKAGFHDLERHASEADAAAVAKLRQSGVFGDLRELRDAAHRSIATGSAPQGLAGRWWAASTARIDALKTLEDRIGEAMRARAQQRYDAALRGLIISVVALAMLLAVVAAAGLFIAWSIVRPLHQIKATMSRMTEGDLTERDDLPSGRNELAEVGDSVRAFRTNLRDTREEVARQEALRKQQEADIVAGVGAGLDALAEGDLTRTVDASLEGPLAALPRNYNNAVAQLRDLMGSVMTRSLQVRSGTSEIAEASEDLARRTERNAATIEQTSAALATIDQRLRQSAQAASETATSTDSAIATVADGRAVAGRANDAMARVSASAKAIDAVIEGLDKIAFQTRVLAMNAAVEAGRAGEAGRGFAVVADLVSALAMRAEEEAQAAREQLTATQIDIGDAVAAVEHVDTALAAITDGVGAVQGLVTALAEDNRAQSTTISEITIAIGTLDQSTQQNAAMVEQSSAAARGINDELNVLTGDIARFRLPPAVAAVARSSGDAAVSLAA